MPITSLGLNLSGHVHCEFTITIVKNYKWSRNGLLKLKSTEAPV